EAPVETRLARLLARLTPRELRGGSWLMAASSSTKMNWVTFGIRHTTSAAKFSGLRRRWPVILPRTGVPRPQPAGIGDTAEAQALTEPPGLLSTFGVDRLAAQRGGQSLQTLKDLRFRRVFDQRFPRVARRQHALAVVRDFPKNRPADGFLRALFRD